MLNKMTIRLADRADWAFAGPETVAGMESATRAEWRGLLEAIAEAEDEPERRLGELSLAIFVLGLGRDLGPGDYQRLLSVPPDDPRAEAMRASFRALARWHAGAVGEAPRARGEGVLAPRRRRHPAPGSAAANLRRDEGGWRRRIAMPQPK